MKLNAQGFGWIEASGDGTHLLVKPVGLSFKDGQTGKNDVFLIRISWMP
jgi:hypothetical protein